MITWSQTMSWYTVRIFEHGTLSSAVFQYFIQHVVSLMDNIYLGSKRNSCWGSKVHALRPAKQKDMYVYPYGHSGAFFCRVAILRMKLHTYLCKTCTAVHRPYHLLCPILGCGIAPNKRAGLLWCFRFSAVHPDLPKNRFHIIIQRYAGSLNGISYHAPRIKPIVTEFTTYILDF